MKTDSRSIPPRGGRTRTQLAGLARYEWRMLWRRQGLLVFAVVFLAGLLLLGLAVRALGQRVNERLTEKIGALSPDRLSQIAQMQATYSAMSSAWPVALFLLTLALPFVAADAIPKDRQTGVRELLDSLPLSRGVYLTGKLLGVWAGVLGVLLGVALLSGAAARLLHGAYDAKAYLVLWAVGIAPLAFFTSGMSVLLAARQPTRRRAAFVGAAFAAYCIAMLATTSGTLWDAVSLARPSVFLCLQLCQLGVGGSELGLACPPVQIPLTIGLGALQIALVWLIVWAWLRRQEGQ